MLKALPKDRIHEGVVKSVPFPAKEMAAVHPLSEYKCIQNADYSGENPFRLNLGVKSTSYSLGNDILCFRCSIHIYVFSCTTVTHKKINDT